MPTTATALKSMGMSDLIALYNGVAQKLGDAEVTEFKSLSFARSEVTRIETKMEQATNPATDTGAVVGDTAAAPAAATAAAATGTVVKASDSKYNSQDKRGPNQGVGAFAKELLLLGKNNADTLAAVMEKFPNAKTSKGCIAFYRTALQRDGKLAKGGGAIPQDPVAMEAAAAKLIADAEALKVKAAETRTALEKAAAEQAAAAAAPATNADGTAVATAETAAA